MGIEFIAYVGVAFIVSLFLASKTDRKFLSFIFVFWILAQPVLTAKFIIPVRALSFDLQPNRILFFIMLFYLFFGMASNKLTALASGGVYTRPKFEKYFYIYLVLVFVSLIINFSSLNPKTIVAVLLGIITFITVYMVAKKSVTESVLDAILRAIILLSIVTAIVAIAQFAIDPMFMRTGEAKAAFDDVLRAFGIFQFDGDLGFFQALAAILILVRYQGKFSRYILLLLVLSSVLVAFHRLGYLIMFICLLSYMAYFSKRKHGIAALVMAVIIPIVLVGSVSYYKSLGVHSKAMEDRLMQDTVSGRLLQYVAVSGEMFHYPVGMGAYENPEFGRVMATHGEGMMNRIVDESRGPWGRKIVAYGIHNGFLAAGLLHGFFAMVTFIAILVSMFRYFKKQISKQNPYSIIPFFAILIWILGNLTQSLMELHAYFPMLVAILCGSFVSLRKNAENPQIAKSDKAVTN